MILNTLSAILALVIWAERPNLLGPEMQYKGAELVACVFQNRLDSGQFGLTPHDEAYSGAWAVSKVDVGDPPAWVYDVTGQCGKGVYFVYSLDDLVHLGLDWNAAEDRAVGNGHGLYVFHDIPPPLPEHPRLKP